MNVSTLQLLNLFSYLFGWFLFIYLFHYNNENLCEEWCLIAIKNYF